MSLIERIQPDWLLPIRPQSEVLTDHDLVKQGEKILEILPRIHADERYPSAECLKLPGQLLMPGLVNCHGHAAMTLLRGFADDYSLFDWLNHHIWPIEAQVVNPDFVETGAWLAATEMVQSGTTCAADSYFFPESTVKGFARVGIRGQVTTPILKFPSPWAATEDKAIDQSLAFFEWAKDFPRLTTGFAPHAVYSVTEAGFTQVQRYAESRGIPIHLHLHESKAEVNQEIAETGDRPIARLDRLGLLTDRLQAVHMTDLTASEIDLLKTRSVRVAHCPESNQKLASGICPVEALISAGITVGLGTDGAASNNDLDLFQELRSASLLAKVQQLNPTALDAYQALEMATIKGAEFLGLDTLIGSLEPGKFADMIAVDLSDIRHQPLYHPISQLVYTATGQDVTHTWVDGSLVYKDGLHLISDLPALRQSVNQWQRNITSLS